MIKIVESLKLIIPGLHQQNKISSTLSKNGSFISPKFEVTLSLNIPSNKTKEGYQIPLSDNQRKEMKRIRLTFSMRGRGRFRGMRRPLTGRIRVRGPMGRNIRRPMRRPFGRIGRPITRPRGRIGRPRKKY